MQLVCVGKLVFLYWKVIVASIYCSVSSDLKQIFTITSGSEMKAVLLLRVYSVFFLCMYLINAVIALIGAHSLSPPSDTSYHCNCVYISLGLSCMS